MEGPKLPIALQAGDLEDCMKQAREGDELLFGLHIQNQVLDYGDLFGLSVSGCLFENCKLTQCDFSKVDIVDTVFQNCDLSGSDFAEGSFVRCRFQDCKGVGIKGRGLRVRNVGVQGCNFSYGIFDESDWQVAQLTGSNLDNASFAGCKLKTIGTKECRLNAINFFKTPLKGMNFTTCELEGIAVSDELWELKGTTVTREQAADLARLMGVIIKD